jgi:hypothetical protein
MNYKILIISILAVLFFANSQAQDKKSFRIVETKVDTAQYPKLTAVVELTANIEPLKGDFKITDEAQRPLEITNLNRKGSDENKLSSRLVYFLIDASNYTEGTYIQSFKTAVKESLGLLGDNDFVNIGYFGYDASGNVTTFSRDFSNNFGLMESDVQSRISASLDSAGATDIMKSLYDAMDKIDESQKDGQKILILISGAIYNNASTYKPDDIVERAKKLNITIHTINYRIDNRFAPDAFRLISNRTEGISAISASSTDIKNAIGDFLENRQPGNTTNTTGTAQYEIEFSLLADALRDGKEHFYKIEYAGTTENGYFYAPGGSAGNFWTTYGLIIIVIAGLLAGLGYWQYNEMRLRKLEEEEAQAEMETQREADMRRKEQEKQSLLQDMQEKNIRLQEQLRLKEQELAKKIDQVPTVIPASKLDPKNTIIGGGGSAPVLQVLAGSFSKNYRLNKPTMTIGRAANNDIVVPEQTVSSHHATITIESGSFFLNDLGSTNGTFVNGTRIDKKLLKSGDIIKMGAANCRFEIS